MTYWATIHVLRIRFIEVERILTSNSAEAPIHLVANFSRREGQLVAAIASSDGSVSALVQLYVV